MDDQVFAHKALEMCILVWNRHPDNALKTPLSALSLHEMSDISLSHAFFSELHNGQHFRDILRELDIADQDQFDLFDTLDVDGNGYIDLEELVAGIAKLRGDARRSDIISVSLMMRALQADFTSFEKDVSRQLKGLQKSVPVTR